MGAQQSSTPELSGFQKRKLLHEFHTFFDVNKNGTLEWKDFEMARQICGMSGWQQGSERFLVTQQLFRDIWRRLGDDGDSNMDGKITSEEWIAMWQRFHRASVEQVVKKGEQTTATAVPDQLNIPLWLDRYVHYKFTLYDRTGDGVIDADEFEYVLSDFGVPGKDARACFLIISKNFEEKVDEDYFRTLCTQYYRSDDPGDLGNFITGRLHFEDTPACPRH
ncbi:calexcitin-2-like isoform X2 [Babylonia areolata]|uniref:calexcitin-2-like isoform X2 n=1 Tax=Babylonia areolata TaxID=304850 RepID=UPI003FCF0260